MYAVGPFTVVHIYPRVFGLIIKNKVNPIDYPNSYIAKQVNEQNHSKKLIHLTSLLFTSVGIYVCFHVIRVIQYGDEVLSSYDNKIHSLPITDVAILSTVFGRGLATILVIRISNSKKHDTEVTLGNLSAAEAAAGSRSTRQTTKTHWPVMLTAAFILVNITKE